MAMLSSYDVFPGVSLLPGILNTVFPSGVYLLTDFLILSLVPTSSTYYPWYYLAFALGLTKRYSIDSCYA